MIARFSMQDNVTSVVEAFANYFELDIEGYESMKVAIRRRALDAMAPGDSPAPLCVLQLRTSSTFRYLLLFLPILLID